MTSPNTPGTPPTNMFMATLNTELLTQWMNRNAIRDTDQAIHRILLETFGEITPRPHRALFPKLRAKEATIYGYTPASAPALKDRATACADPLQAAVIPADMILTKPMPANWTAGERFGFDIRTRPIIRVPIDSPRLNPDGAVTAPSRNRVATRESDVYLLHIINSRENNLPAKDMRTVYAEWLAHLLERQGGASLDPNSASLESFKRGPVSHKNPAISRNTSPDVTIHGTLTVRDPEAFGTLIANGAGRQKTYGYGMLIIRAVAN